MTSAAAGGGKEPHASRIYSDLSGFYDRVFTHVFADRIEQVVGAMGIQPGEKVLEVGIGTGLSLNAFPAVCQVTGIDLSQEMLDHARQKMDERHAHIDLQQGDGMNLAFEDGSFDYVMAFHVITVVPEPRRMLEENVQGLQARRTGGDHQPFQQPTAAGACDCQPGRSR